MNTTASVILPSIVVDCDLAPHVPRPFRLVTEKHREMGKLTLEKRGDGKLYVGGIKIVRYQSPKQIKNRNSFTGYALEEEVKWTQILNARVIVEDVCRNNPHLIPDEWKHGSTFFLGDTFWAGGRRYGKALYYCQSEWDSYFYSLDNDFRKNDYDNYYVAVFESLAVSSGFRLAAS